jgi:hypothetical protein
LSSDPKVPEPSDLPEPLYETWAGGSLIRRCHDSRFGATEFNPGAGSGRFHPFLNAAGAAVPTLYGSDTYDGAFSETIFHDVPVRGAGRAILRSMLRPMLVSTIAVNRDLKLIQLHGFGLRRLGVTRAQLIDSEAEAYSVTTRWARVLHDENPSVDGLVWMSRQHDTSRAFVLFGSRVDRSLLSVAEVPVPLAIGVGFDKVQAAAEQAGITIVE